jgi:hypothetical protein
MTMIKDITNKHASSAEVVGPDHAQPGHVGVHPWPYAPIPRPDRPDDERTPSGKADQDDDQNDDQDDSRDDGNTVVTTYDVVNPPSHDPPGY